MTGDVAAALVDAGARVLVVASDLYEPHKTPLLGRHAENSRGLADYLTAASTEEEVIQHHAPSRVDVLPAGHTPANPADLVHSQALAALLQNAAQTYDFVLLTAPATSLGTDASAIAARCDGTVLVLASRDTRRPQLQSALRQLERVDAPVLGGVLLC